MGVGVGGIGPTLLNYNERTTTYVKGAHGVNCVLRSPLQIFIGTFFYYNKYAGSIGALTLR